MISILNNELFPTKLEGQRIAQESIYKDFLECKTNGIYSYGEDYTGRTIGKEQNPIVPIASTISEIYSDLLFGQMPTITINDEKNDLLFNEWAEENFFHEKLIECSLYTSAVGTVFCTMFIHNGEIKYTFTPSNSVIWKENIYGDLEEVNFILNKENKANTTTEYEVLSYYLENNNLVIETNLITTDIQRKITNNIVIQRNIYSEINFIPIIKILNYGMMNQKNGRSDYLGKEQLFAEIDNRIDKNNSVLEENAEPWKALPPGVLDVNGNFNRANYNAKMFEKAINGGTSENTVDIFTWDASLQASFQQIDKMIELAFFTARISAPISGLDKGGQSDSGRALKWKSINTFAMINRKRIYFNKFIKSFVQYWCIMNNLNIDIKDITIEWYDGLPLDFTEDNQNIIEQYKAGLRSKRSAISELRDITDEDLEDELKDLNNTNNDLNK
jgi:hypothetical protein